MIQQKPRKPQAQQSSSLPSSQSPLTPETFIFRQQIIDILSHCKKNIKGPPFEDMNVDKLVQANQNRAIDGYLQYFLIGIGMGKTRELVCNRIERLIRENVVNKDMMPSQIITGIVNARTVGPSGGGSTASSGSNSVVGSASNLSTEKPLEIGKLVSTIICHTIQPSSQISTGLLYLLQGTRNKNNGAQFSQLIEDVYNCLSKFRKKPIDRFLGHFLARVVSQVQYHEAPYYEYERKYLSDRKNKPRQSNPSMNKYNKAPSIMQQAHQGDQPKVPPPPVHNFIPSPPAAPFTKQQLCIHPQEEDSKFGKCFICDRGANNYDKTLFVPLCSMDCKNRLKRINQECLMNDHFGFVKWILEVLGASNAGPGLGDQVIYSLLLREVVEGERLSQEDIASIMEICVNNFSMQAIGITSSSQTLQTLPNGLTNKIIENCSIIMSCLVRKYPGLLLRDADGPMVMKEEGEREHDGVLPNFHQTKVILMEMTRLLQSLPITNNSLQLTLLKSLAEILSARQHTPQSPLIVLKHLYLHCDCRVLQTNLVERIMNIISQYALFNSSSSSSGSSSLSSSASMQNLGTSTSLGTENSSNALSMGMINNASLSANGCSDTAINVLDDILSSMTRVMNQFAVLGHGDSKIGDIIKEKKIKKYIQSKFVEDFNKKPGKAVDALRKLFDNKISPKDIAIILRQNMDYETKVKKTVQRINKQEVGTYFGTAKKDKNAGKDDFNQEVYWEFLKLLSKEYEGREVDDCLRITFNSFLMPKEGQQVEVVLGPLSLALEPYLGLKTGNEATATYQLIMVVLMVQTSTNPNVKQNEKLKYEGFKKFCADIDENFTEARMLQIFERVKKRPLEVLMDYRGKDVFTKKYLSPGDLKTQFWRNLPNLSLIEEKKEEKVLESSSTLSAGKQTTTGTKSEVSPQKEQPKQLKKQPSPENPSPKQQQPVPPPKSEQKLQKPQMERIESRSSIEIEQPIEPLPQKSQNILSFTFLNLWQYIYMSIINRNNLRGLEQACILYGRAELLTQFEAFFNHLYKMHIDFQHRSSSTSQNISNSSKLIILKLAIDYSNCVIGRQAWLIIIKIIYKLDIEDEEKPRQSPRKGQPLYSSYEYEASDKLFTRTNTFNSLRLKQFLQAMCEFSSSEVKTDVKYTREMYILHHIAEIIEYNLDRFEGLGGQGEGDCLWGVLWPTMRAYFRNICLHPRKEISMSAIDSYKQLTMKMLKLKPSPSSPSTSPIDHTQLISIYLYIFQRSPSYIKDLITNILLNVVCPQLRSGWNELYTMLEISDSEDKTVVMKVINRLIRDVGLDRVGNPVRLHQIVLKELRIGGEGGYGDVVGALWEICGWFDRVDIWLETLSKVKDIYKSTTHVQILLFFYRLCNRCLTKISQLSSPPAKKALKQKGNMQQIQDQLQQTLMHQALQQPQQSSTPALNPQQAHKLIYFQVFSAQMHILQIKNARLFTQTINIFKQLNLDIFFRNIGNDGQGDHKTGFLALWEMFIGSPSHTVQFCYFLNEYFGVVWKELARVKGEFTGGREDREGKYRDCIRSLEQLTYIKKQIILWLIRLFVQTSKDQVLQLSQQDSDLRKSYSQILQQKISPSSKTQLIQFYLSSKEYEAKSIQHLVLLKIFKTFYQNETELSLKQREIMGDLGARVLEIVLESYTTALEVNNKPLLRNFLWHNQFFKGQDYLPGLMKQELRSYDLIVRHFPLGEMKGKVYAIVIGFIQNFIQKSSLLSSKYEKGKQKQPRPAQPMKPQLITADQSQNQSLNRLTQTLYQDIGLWITNSQQLLSFSLRKISKELSSSTLDLKGKAMGLRELFQLCIQLSKVTNSRVLLRDCGVLMEELVGLIY